MAFAKVYPLKFSTHESFNQFPVPHKLLLPQVVEEKEMLELRMEKRELQGDYDPRKTRVLKMTRQNPFDVASEAYDKRMEDIEAENVRMRKKIIQLQTAAKVGF